MSDALGTVLVLGGCFLAASGYVLQKKGNLQWSGEHSALRKPIYFNRLWLAGLVCMVISALLVVASAPFLDQSKSAPLGAATLVFNTLLSALVLGEPFLVLHLISTILIVCGAVTSSSANPSPSADLTYSQILGLFDGVAVGFTIVCAALAAYIVYTLRRIVALPKPEWSAQGATLVSLLAPALGGCCNGFVSYATKVVTTAAGKGDSAALASLPFWIYLVVLGGAVCGQVTYLNLGLAYFSAMQIVPVFQCAIIFSNSICGIVYFGDMRSNPSALAVFFVGAAICGGGILLLLLDDSGGNGGAGGSSSAAGGDAGKEGGAVTGGPGEVLILPPAPVPSQSAPQERSTGSGVWPSDAEQDHDSANLSSSADSSLQAAPSKNQKKWYLKEVKAFFVA
jgi:uncharacterized membrane protein